MATARRATIIELPDDEALMGERLVPVEAGPLVAHRLRMGPAIHHHDGRIGLCWIKANGFYQASIEQRAIGALHLMELGRQEIILFESLSIGRANDPQLSTIGLMQGPLRRRRQT